MVTLTNNGSLYARARQRNNQQPQPAAAVAPVVQQQPQQVMPQVDPNNAIGSLAELIGPTPAEREARQAQLERNRQKMASWTALFDGLRHLGNLYYTAKGARPQQYANPYTQIEQNYQRDMQLADAQDAYRRQYAQQLYQLQRQQAQDALAKEVHKSQMDWRKTQAEALAEKTRQQDERNQAIIRHYDAVAQRDTYAAAYNKAKAEGYPDEVAAKIAKYQADTEKSVKQGNAAMIRANKAGSGGSGKKSTKKAAGRSTTTATTTTKTKIQSKTRI